MYPTLPCIYIFTWVREQCRQSPGTCGPDGVGDFAEFKSTACVFLVGNMHMISREAAGLKPEAVVSYIQGKEREREKEGGRKVRETPNSTFSL